MNDAQLLKPQSKDLGDGFLVRRLLPNVQRQSVGPFIFFDHFGPVNVTPPDNHDVRPHPHIGLATLTYLFDGAIMHRDNLGYAQRIEPGAVNLMFAGRGIVHSERKPEQEKLAHYINHGLQLWIAVPQEQEKAAPWFAHTPAALIPEVKLGRSVVRVLAGEAFGGRSPVRTLSPTIYLDIWLDANAELDLPLLADEQALYTVSGDLTVDGQPLELHAMHIMSGAGSLKAGEAPVRLVLIGGQSLGHRFIWWNFVASDKEDIKAAARAWERGEVSAGMGQVPGESEKIPLPRSLD